MAGFFCFSILYLGKLIPSSVTALGVGRQAPSSTLLNADGKQVALADLLKNHCAALLILPRLLVTDLQLRVAGLRKALDRTLSMRHRVCRDQRRFTG
jgi:hypothetical protein